MTFTRTLESQGRTNHVSFQKRRIGGVADPNSNSNLNLNASPPLVPPNQRFSTSTSRNPEITSIEARTANPNNDRDEERRMRIPQQEQEHGHGHNSLSGRNRCISSDDAVLSWVFNRASVAPCFVRDVFEMEEGNIGNEKVLLLTFF